MVAAWRVLRIISGQTSEGRGEQNNGSAWRRRHLLLLRRLPTRRCNHHCFFAHSFSRRALWRIGLVHIARRYYVNGAPLLFFFFS